ncbi:transposase [Lentibacillus sp.]|uniref:RNA-guided endonuclease InsQ/TnpB family protein n=1 Tax=Lentibacillus sp. TaxID=1925746 RepID=UPI002B4B05C4|nr:transposase [Lentibacillus sp.]
MKRLALFRKMLTKNILRINPKEGRDDNEKTYKFKLEPNQEQEASMNWVLMMSRQLYNAMLEQRIFAYKTRDVSVHYYGQKKELPLLKQEVPDYKKIQSQVLQDVAGRLDKAFQAFFRRLKAKQKAGFPRFQGDNRYHSFTYPQSGFALNGKCLKLSKIGNVRIKCHRQIEGTIKTCTIRRQNNKWYACFSCEIDVDPAPTTGEEIGIDLGILNLATASNGDLYENHHFLKQSEKKIRYWNKILARRKKGSRRWHKAKQQLAKTYEQLANRRDRAHKVSRQLADQYDLIAFEDLNIQDMVKRKTLAKQILDASWRSLIAYTTYKA